MSIPIVKVTTEIEGIRQNIIASLSRHQDEISELVRYTVERHISSDEFRVRIQNSVTTAVDQAVRKSIEASLQYGEGQKFIRSLVDQALSQLRFRA